MTTEKKQSVSFNKDLLQYIASSVFVVLLFLLLGYLTFIEVPAANKDVIITILGVILGGAATALPKILGETKDSETNELKRRIDKLEYNNGVLIARNQVLKEEFDKLTALLINRHVLSHNGEPYDDSYEIKTRPDEIDKQIK